MDLGEIFSQISFFFMILLMNLLVIKAHKIGIRNKEHNILKTKFEPKLG